MLELYLGGARSGKSRLAEQQAECSGLEPVYLATAEAGDAEMAERIEHHQARRSERWLTCEEPFDLAGALQRIASPGRCVVVDCLTLWLTNLLCDECRSVESEKQKLLAILPTLPGRIILVSNEVGHGIVPMGELSRRFVDESGWLHQDIAALADRAVWVVAGLPQVLKGESL